MSTVLLRRLTRTRIPTKTRGVTSPRKRFCCDCPDKPGSVIYTGISIFWGSVFGCGCFVELRDLENFRRKKGLIKNFIMDMVFASVAGIIMGITWPISIPLTLLLSG